MEATKSTFIELRLTDEVINRLADLGYTPESLREEIKNHEQTNGSDSPALYCGTYGKYNTGNFRGMWVDLSTFDSYEDFINFCKAIHADEDDPELMYQDGENIASCAMNTTCWQLKTFWSGTPPEDLDMMPDAYVGVYDSEEDFAREIVNERYDIDKMMGNLADYFEYNALARDLFMCDYYFGSRGTVFARF